MARPSKWPPEFRARAVALYRDSEGRTIAEVAQELGVGPETFRKWVRQDEADRGERPDRPTSSEQMELRRLRKENAELRRTNEILAQELDPDPAVAVRFVQSYRTQFPVATLCTVINLPVSTFYERAGRVPSARAVADARLAEWMEKIWVESDRSYGSPRVHAQLARDGIRVGRKRVERIMAEHGWQGAFLRHGWQRTTRPDRVRAGTPDLVERNFTAVRPHQLWVADLTYVRTFQGFFYLAMVLDVFTHRLVGWMMGDTLRTELVLGALEMAIHRRDATPAGTDGSGADGAGRLIHHSDRGSQYTGFAFSQRLAEAGITGSLGSTGDSFDNAMAESWFGTIKIELIYRRVWRSRHDAELGIFRWIEGWYNPRRIQRALGWRSPIEYETGFHAGVDLSVPATAKPAPVLAGVKQTALDTGRGPAHGHSGGNDQENGHPEESPVIVRSQ